MAKILVVEDEPVILDVIGRVLTRAGHEVLKASTAEEARFLAGLSPTLDAVITDVGLRDESGFDLAHGLRAEVAGIAVLIVSGASHHRASLPGPPSAFLPKPFTPSQLLDLLAKLIREKDQIEARGQPPGPSGRQVGR